jgi:hypothetical protein
LSSEKSTIQNVTPLEAINYYCEMENDKIKFSSPEPTDGARQTGSHEDLDRNTVIVIPKLETNSVLIRLGESNTDNHRPKRTEAGKKITFLALKLN